MQYKADYHDNYKKELAKIRSVSFGQGGYQDAQFGLNLDFEGKGIGCGAFVGGGWDYSIEVDEYTKWTEEDRAKQMAEMCKTISQILRDAKCSTVDQLKNKPVELSIDVNVLRSWRILEEVL